MKLDDELVEKAARGICLSYGQDPEEFVAPNLMCGPNNEKLPMWQVYEEQARAAITAYLAGAVESGKARAAHCAIISDEDGDTWLANEVWVDGDFPSLILKVAP
jgi:hypothetical protein